MGIRTPNLDPHSAKKQYRKEMRSLDRMADYLKHQGTNGNIQKPKPDLVDRVFRFFLGDEYPS
jgi:hypothetical protein